MDQPGPPPVQAATSDPQPQTTTSGPAMKLLVVMGLILLSVA